MVKAFEFYPEARAGHSRIINSLSERTLFVFWKEHGSWIREKGRVKLLLELYWHNKMGA